MDRDTDAGRPLQFFPVDIGHYRHHACLDARAEVDALADLLAPFGAETNTWDVEDEQEKGADAVEQRLRAWSQPQTSGDTFLYWVGHGESDGQSALLAHAYSPRPLTSGGVTPEALLQYLAARQANRRARGSWAIVVIDACRSARFVELLSARALSDSSGGPRNVLLVSTSEDGTANLGQFRKALTTALTVTFPAEDIIDLWALAGELSKRLHGCPVIPHSPAPGAVLHRKVPSLASALSAPLDALAEFEASLASLTDHERRHIVLKAVGAELDLHSRYFEGRVVERQQVLTWLKTARSGLLVVTGAAGAGKSALLGHVLMHTRPELGRLLEGSGHPASLSTEAAPPEESFDAVLHLCGVTPHELISRIATAATLGSPPTDASLAVQSNWLNDQMRRRRRRFTMLADALDEAQLPLVTAEHILRPLAELPHVRVVIGTRASTTQGPEPPQPKGQNLLDALGATTNSAALVINLAPEPEAVVRYVRRRLIAAARRHEFTGALGNVDRLATGIASCNREFLYVRLAVNEIIQNDALFGALEGLDSLLASDARQLFADTVDRLSALAPTYRPLLESLALAQGRGFPVRDSLWASAASAVSDNATITDTDIMSLTRAAAPYLTVDTEFGQSVYRLAHYAFAEHFLNLASGDHRHHLITTRLAADADEQPPAAQLNPYLVRYLPAHASLGGLAAWHQLAKHPRVMDRLDPTAFPRRAQKSKQGTADAVADTDTAVAGGQLGGQLLRRHHAPGPPTKRRRRMRTALLITGAVLALLMTGTATAAYWYYDHLNSNLRRGLAESGASRWCNSDIAEGTVTSIQPDGEGRMRATLSVERWYRPVESSRGRLTFTAESGEWDDYRNDVRILVVVGPQGELQSSFRQGTDLEAGRRIVAGGYLVRCETPTPLQNSAPSGR
ncbi:ATP-binding protein [Streptomyces sp. PKU-MA01144]|uniref:caspase family protein n=1 Tax=Streptomyces sp. PKU-MA01144 TaxID=2729138 RepID=UPI00147A1D3C|nr:caspase family protein [Streptomyces sp. PKU-MA01144]NNJ08374.1 ATP-binding protein [Streptomyces sp. PKU-MA01144]